MDPSNNNKFINHNNIIFAVSGGIPMDWLALNISIFVVFFLDLMYPL